MTVVIILDTLLSNFPIVDSFLSCVFDWLWILSVSLRFLCNRWLFLLIADSKYKNFVRNRQSSTQNSRDKSIFLRKLTPSCASVLNTWSHSFLVCLLITSSVSHTHFHISKFPLRPPSNFFIHSLSTRSVQDTTPEVILSSCGCSLTLTLTASMDIWYDAGAMNSWLRPPSMSCTLFVSVIFGQLPLHFLSWPLFRKLKNSSTKWQSRSQIRIIEQRNQSFLANWTDWTLSSHDSLWFLDNSSDQLSLGSTTPFGRPSASFENSFTLSLRLTIRAVSLSVLSKTQHHKTFSLNTGAF